MGTDCGKGLNAGRDTKCGNELVRLISPHGLGLGKAEVVSRIDGPTLQL